MTNEQSATLAQLAYLDWPPDAITKEDFVKYHREKLDSDTLKEFEPYFKKVDEDPYLSSLTLVGYSNNKLTGFTGYAFQESSSSKETTSSRDGVVSFRGSGDVFDWINNIVMETQQTSPQELEARAFMANKKNGAGMLDNIDVTGHSLGGYLAQTMALFDSRVQSATTFNAPGVSASFMKKYSSLITPENLSKIDAATASGDVVSKLGHPLVLPGVVPGSFDIGAAHSMNNFQKGSETMGEIGFKETGCEET